MPGSFLWGARDKTELLDVPGLPTRLINGWLLTHDGYAVIAQNPVANAKSTLMRDPRSLPTIAPHVI